MNKLRLIKIYELRKQVHPMEQYVIDILDGIEQVPYRNVYIRYKKDNIEYFTFILRTNDIYLSYHLDNKFKDNFGCYIDEREEIIKYLLKKHLKITIDNVYI